jgi:hypothetical protein
MFERTLTCNGETCTIRMSVPFVGEAGEYICCYEIIMQDQSAKRKAFGVDAIQAFMMALMQAGSFLYSGKLIDPEKTFWLSPHDMGYLGLPVPIEDQERLPSGPKLILAM